MANLNTQGLQCCASADAMASSTLDLFVLTFNCAKNLINVAVFASHLQAAFKQNATTLPDVVVLSLQEVAPLSYSFIGGYFLSPYFSRYEDALNLAAAQFSAQSQVHRNDEDEDTIIVEPTEAPGPVGPYTLIRARNVGMTAIMLFARDPVAVQQVQEAEVGFGAAEMGNKGAVGLRMLYEGRDPETGVAKASELTFVATHLAAMEWNLPRRNANWAAIMRGLTFENPEVVLSPKTTSKKNNGDTGSATSAVATSTARSQGTSTGEDASGSEDEDHGEHDHLLHAQHHARDMALQAKLHNISVFKPSSHLFVAGDLNYRISSRSPPPLAKFPSMDPESDHYYPRYFALDQLTRERKAGRTFHGMSEAEVKFPPTYKYDILPAIKTGSGSGTKLSPDAEAVAEDVPWSFAPHRYPSWTDRVLFLDVPQSAQRRVASEETRMRVKAYDALPVIRTSDHRAVFLRVGVPLLSEEEMTTAEMASVDFLDGSATGDEVWKGGDPRITLPVAIDPEAWERRAAARRREMFVGWGMFLWSTKEGAVVIATMLAVGVGGWWLIRG